MPKKTTKVPDAWDDDDWEAQADQAEATEEQSQGLIPAEETTAPLSKAERLAKHAESNRKLWESAEVPADPFHYLSARADPPLATTFKPAMRVLSRKPAPQTITRRDPATGAISQLTIDDSEEQDLASQQQATPEEIRARQQREREEKQRRYDEARAKIFGTVSTSSNPSSGVSTPTGNVTPPLSTTRDAGGTARGQRGGTRGRGGRGPGHRYNDSRGEREAASRPGTQPAGSPARELYDPSYSPKPGFQLERRGGSNAQVSGRSTPREDDQIIRAPRGPDSNSRGFARRGGRGD